MDADSTQGEHAAQARAAIASVAADALDKGAGTWAALGEAGLLGLVASEAGGGEGLGLAELGVLLRAAGERASDLPLWETLAAGLLTLTECGDDSGLTARIASGVLLVAPAIAETGEALPHTPRVCLSAGTLSGTKLGVRVYAEPSVLFVLADSGEPGPGRAPDAVVAVVDPGAPGVTRRPSSSSRGIPQASYDFDHVSPMSVLPAGSGQRLLNNSRAGMLLWADGLLAGARDLTARYVAQREQFGRPLAQFQGVAMQIADVYITARMFSLGAAEAARRVGAGEPAQDDLAIAAYWLCARGLPALQTCHHLHGGVGVDETYPLHHYFAAVKDVARALGGAEAGLAAVPMRADEGVNAELTQARRDFKAEVGAYFDGLVSTEDRLELMRDRHGPAYHRTIKQLGTDGWMGVGWPKEYGGQGLGEIEQQIFVNEAARADVHLPAVTLQTVGPTLMAFGTEAQKRRFLPDILTGDVHFAIGYSEADSGTDLASLRTSARRDGDDFVVNGQKLWTTGGHVADYIWLAVRTDPQAPKHKGISVLIVDTKDPGYSWTPIITCDGSHHVNATYYNDIRVPADLLVGTENEGWKLITAQLNHERVMLGPAGRIEGLRDLVEAWARVRTTAVGEPLLGVESVRATLARATASFRLNELLNWAVAGSGASGSAAVADASASKVFGSEEVQRIGLELEEIVSAYGDPAEPDTAYLLELLDATSKRNLVLTFGGGVNEVQRELIAMFGLGLPKVPR